MEQRGNIQPCSGHGCTGAATAMALGFSKTLWSVEATGCHPRFRVAGIVKMGEKGVPGVTLNRPKQNTEGVCLVGVLLGFFVWTHRVDIHLLGIQIFIL